MDLKEKNLFSWQNIWNSRQITADTKKKFRKSRRDQGNHATELSTVVHVISERHWKSTFDFTEIVNHCGLKREQYVKLPDLFPTFLWNYT